MSGGRGDIKIAATSASSSASSEKFTVNLGAQPVTVAFDAALEGSRAALRSLRVDAFSGRVDMSAEAQLDGAKPFSSNVKVAGMRVEQALALEHVMADTVRAAHELRHNDREQAN